MPATSRRLVPDRWYLLMPYAILALLLSWLVHDRWATRTLAARATSIPAADGGQVMNVAHRGASGHAPEHTLAAYDLALTFRAHYIEQDLQLTRDGALVVLHDPTLDRTARGPAEDCTGPVIEKELAQIRSCDVGSWFNTAYPPRSREEFTGLRIPTLDEVFTRYGTRANFYIETKNPESAPGMEEKLLALLQTHGLRDEAVESWKVLVQSFSAASLHRMHRLDPALPLVQLYGGPGDSSATIRATLDSVAAYAVGIGPSARMIDSALVAAARARCLEIHPYTVNDTTLMRSLVAVGVSGMFTNFPDRLHALIPQRPKRDYEAVDVAVRGARDAHLRCRAARRMRGRV